MQIKVLGSGCCDNSGVLAQLTRETLADLGVAAEITTVTDFPTIVGYGVMTTPALVVDEQVVLSGRVPGKDQLRELLASLAG